MTAQARSPDWIGRLQGLLNETMERFTASTANFQRLLAAIAGPGYTPELLASELPRFSAEHGPDAYRRLVEINTRFMSRTMRLVSRYRDEYLRGLLPPGRLVEAGRPSVVPPPPEGADAADWTGWYQLYSAWIAEQQAWSARLYRILLEEVAAGALKPEEVQATARDFMQRRLPDYLADMAELNAELVSDLIALADSSYEALSDVLVGRPNGRRERPSDGDEPTVELHGPAGTTAQAGLVVENTRAEPAVVQCLVTPVEGFDVVTAPTEFSLAPGESRPVTIRVALPAEPTRGPQPAGRVIIRGQGDTDLVVHVRAAAEARVHDAPPGPTPGE